MRRLLLSERDNKNPCILEQNGNRPHAERHHARVRQYNNIILIYHPIDAGAYTYQVDFDARSPKGGYVGFSGVLTVTPVATSELGNSGSMAYAVRLIKLLSPPNYSATLISENSHPGLGSVRLARG